MTKTFERLRAIALLAGMTMLAACGSKPGPDDVRQALRENLPEALRTTATVDQVQSEMTVDGDSVAVKFKSQLKTDQPLYVSVDLRTLATSSRADLASFGEVDRVAGSLSPRLQQEFAPEISKLKERPTFIEQSTAANASTDWYGSYRAKKVVDRWVVSDFRTEVQPSLKGIPRQAFPADAITRDAASSWLAERQRDQQAFLQRVADAQKLQETEERLAAAQAAAEQAKQTGERADRRMPLGISARPSALGGDDGAASPGATANVGNTGCEPRASALLARASTCARSDDRIWSPGGLGVPQRRPRHPIEPCVRPN